MENTDTDTRDFELWERQMRQRKDVWYAKQADRDHERLMREAVEAAGHDHAARVQAAQRGDE